MESTHTRSLAAIMFTDIAGYTAMMQENETAAAAVRAVHREVFEKEHQRFNGELLRYYGDGTLSTFRSAVEAVHCAVSMQQQFNSSGKVPLRIGMHIGDIVFNNDDIYGDGVNLASRIESLGVPGSVLITDRLYDAVKNQQGIQAKSMGYFEFKNIREPVEVYALAQDGIKVPDRSDLKGKLKENKKSIAVLPFVNMSADPENEYFSDGISEEILNGLVRVKGLQVTARTSSFSFKGRNMDVREIGSQLGVSHLLEGSVRKSGNRVRITAQLVSTVDGYHFFSETYDRTLDDIFLVQEEIARKITHLLRRQLGESEHTDQLIKAPTQNMDAYELYLKGLYFFNQWGSDGMVKAIPFFRQAIDTDPHFAMPHARLAVCVLMQTFGGKLSWAEAHKNAMVHISRVRELGVDTAESSFANAVFEIFFNWDWNAALEAIKTGLEKFPNFPSLHHALSTLYYINGNMQEAIRCHITGLELDPKSVEMNYFMGVAYLWNGEPDQALPYLEWVVELIPGHRAAREDIGWSYFLKGEYGKALLHFEKLEPGGFRLHRSTCLGMVYTKMGETLKANACLEELLGLEKDFIGVGLDLAVLYTGIGEFDKAFYFLEKIIRNRFGDSMMIKTDILLAPLKSDPRFSTLEQLVGTVPAIHIEH